MTDPTPEERLRSTLMRQKECDHHVFSSTPYCNGCLLAEIRDIQRAAYRRACEDIAAFDAAIREGEG